MGAAALSSSFAAVLAVRRLLLFFLLLLSSSILRNDAHYANAFTNRHHGILVRRGRRQALHRVTTSTSTTTTTTTTKHCDDTNRIRRYVASQDRNGVHQQQGREGQGGRGRQHELRDLFVENPGLERVLKTDVFQLYAPPPAPPAPSYDDAAAFLDRTRTDDVAMSVATPAAANNNNKASSNILERVMQTPRNLIGSVKQPNGAPTTKPPPFTLGGGRRNYEHPTRPNNALSSNRQSATAAGSVAGSLVAAATAAMATVPEAVAAAFAAGVPPSAGIWTTVAMNLASPLAGSRRGIVNGASPGIAASAAALSAARGSPYVSACAVLAGVLQLLAGRSGVAPALAGRIPHAVLLGFANGMAARMALLQLKNFVGLNPWASAAGGAAYGVCALTVALAGYVLPRFAPRIPSTLGAVAIATITSSALQLPVKTLADFAFGSSGSGAATSIVGGGWSALPKLAFPQVPLNLHTLRVILPFAATMAVVGLLESLLTMQLIDGIVGRGGDGDDHQNSSPSSSSAAKECYGQGAGNVASGLVGGGMGGSALLGQSLVNVQNGGSASRLSSIAVAGVLAAGLLSKTGSTILGSIPSASLVGVMLLVCQSTFSFSSWRQLKRIPLRDMLVVAFTSLTTVRKTVIHGVVYGTLLAFVLNKLRAPTSAGEALFAVEHPEDRVGNSGSKVYQLNGSLFFGSTSAFFGLFRYAASDPDTVVLDFTNARVHDYAGLHAIGCVADKYGALGKTVVLRGLSNNTASRLRKLLYHVEGTVSPVIDPLLP